MPPRITRSRARSPEKVARIPGAADVHIHQVVDYPTINIDVDRSKAGQVGLTQRDVATSLLISLSSSGQIAPTQFLDWRTGVSYGVAVQTPQYRMDSLAALLRTPVSAPFTGVNSTTATSTAGSANPTNASVGAGPNQASAAYGNPGIVAGGPQLLSNMVTVGRSVGPEIVNHYNVQPVMDVYANVDRRDLGSVGAGVEKIIKEMTPETAARHHASNCADRSAPWRTPSTASAWA